MPLDHHTILGLTSAECGTRELDQRFIARRRELTEALEDPAKFAESRRALDDLYRAYKALRNHKRNGAPVHIASPEDDETERVSYLRRYIEESLEGTILRCSRRREVLAEGRRLGYSEFHMQLLIAQVQFGGDLIAPPKATLKPNTLDRSARVGSRVAAAGVLALALFLAMIRWLNMSV